MPPVTSTKTGLPREGAILELNRERLWCAQVQWSHYAYTPMPSLFWLRHHPDHAKMRTPQPQWNLTLLIKNQQKINVELHS